MRTPGTRVTGAENVRWGDRLLLRRVGTVAWGHRRALGVSLVLLPLISGLQLLQPWIIKLAIDGPIAEGQRAGLIPIAVAFFGVLSFQYLAQFVQSYQSHIAGQGIVHDLRLAVHRHILGRKDRFFQDRPAGTLLTRCTSDVEGIGEMFAAGFLTLVGDVVLLAGICFALLALNWRLAVVTFVLLPPLVGVSWWFQIRLRSAYRGIRRRVAELNSILAEQISGIRIIQLFAQEERAQREFEGHNSHLMAEHFRGIRLDATLFAFVDMMGHLAVAVLLAYAVQPIADGVLSLGALVAFLDYVARFFVPVRDLSQKVATLQSGLDSAERVFDLLDIDEALPEAEGAQPPEEVRGRIDFADVHFSYDPAEPVLRGLSFHVEPGESMAIVGPTGAGKTTALRLINRLYECTSGTVSLDGSDVRHWNKTALRRSVGVVLQDPFLFGGSVRDNLCLLDPSISDAACWEALRDVGLSERIQGLGGLVGSVGERGDKLSAGERQLLALARVLLYDPAVLILDEASSNLDAFSEERTQHAIERVMTGRTTLVVAHRLSTIHGVDRIAVLSGGKLAELGSHGQLMERSTLYRRLYETYYALGPGDGAVA